MRLYHSIKYHQEQVIKILLEKWHKISQLGVIKTEFLTSEKNNLIEESKLEASDIQHHLNYCCHEKGFFAKNVNLRINGINTIEI